MFTINIYLKFAIIAVLLIGGIALAIAYGFWYAFPLLLVGVGFLASYFLLGTVQSAAQMVETQDIDAAENRLALTLWPNLLYKANRAYYYMLKGSFAAQRKQSDVAENFFIKARDTGLPTGNEEAMVLLQLANLQATKGKWNQAKLYFKEAKKIKVTEPTIKAQLNQFEKGIQNRGQMKHTRSGQYQMKGRNSKRNRPRIR